MANNNDDQEQTDKVRDNKAATQDNAYTDNVSPAHEDTSPDDTARKSTRAAYLPGSNPKGSKKYKSKHKALYKKNKSGLLSKLSNAISLSDSFNSVTGSPVKSFLFKTGAVFAATTVFGGAAALFAGVTFTAFSIFKDWRAEKERESFLQYIKDNKQTVSQKFLLSASASIIGYGLSDFFGLKDIFAAGNNAAPPPPIPTSLNVGEGVNYSELYADFMEPVQAEVPAENIEMSTCVSSDHIAIDGCPDTDTPTLAEEDSQFLGDVFAEENMADDSDTFTLDSNDTITIDDLSSVTLDQPEIDTTTEAELETNTVIAEDHEIITSEETASMTLSTTDEFLSALENSSELSPQAQAMIDAAQRGETWAVRDTAIGIINGSYGFDNIPTDLNAQQWAGQLLEQAAQTGDEWSRINHAYLQYHGINGISADQDAALSTINELGRSWVGGESLLDQTDLDQQPLTQPESQPEAQPAAEEVTLPDTTAPKPAVEEVVLQDTPAQRPATFVEEVTLPDTPAPQPAAEEAAEEPVQGPTLTFVNEHGQTIANDNLNSDEQTRLNVFSQILQSRGIDTQDAAVIASNDGTYTLRKTFTPSAEHQAFSEHFGVNLKGATVHKDYIATQIEEPDAPQVAALH